MKFCHLNLKQPAKLTDNQEFTPIIEAKISARILTSELLKPKDEILLGISGGSDSVALFHFLVRKGYKVSLAHCNYQLRSDDANTDEQFVRELAKQYKVKAHFIKFDTHNILKTSKGSLQMVARDLRYEYFEKLSNEFKYDVIAIATNLNDQLETVLLNLTKGTGIKGLSGIEPKRKNIVRPLLDVSKTEIKNYLKELGQNHREDLSNQENKYQRNLIRNTVIPELEKINPDLLQTFRTSLEHLKMDESASEFGLRKALKICKLKNSKEEVSLEIEKLLEFEFFPKIIWEVSKKFGFTSLQIDEIKSLIKSQSGKYVKSEKAICLKNRNHLVFSLKSKEIKPEIIIKKLPFKKDSLEITEIKNAPLKSIKSKNQEFVDGNKIILPLKIRMWKTGDKMIPLGMKGSKKVSDILIDSKTSYLEKEKQLILENGDGKIIWLVGKRISESFKLTEHTKQKLQLLFSPLP